MNRIGIAEIKLLTDPLPACKNVGSQLSVNQEERPHDKPNPAGILISHHQHLKLRNKYLLVKSTH